MDNLNKFYSVLKSASTNVIISNKSDLRVFSNWRQFQILRSMADLLGKVRAYVIGRRFEIDFIIFLFLVF